MPFFNFEVRTPMRILSSDGGELENINAARVEAANRIGELLRTHAGDLWVYQEWQMDVTDHTGLLIYAIEISALKSAATAHVA